VGIATNSEIEDIRQICASLSPPIHHLTNEAKRLWIKACRNPQVTNETSRPVCFGIEGVLRVVCYVRFALCAVRSAGIETQAGRHAFVIDKVNRVEQGKSQTGMARTTTHLTSAKATPESIERRGQVPHKHTAYLQVLLPALPLHFPEQH